MSSDPHSVAPNRRTLPVKIALAIGAALLTLLLVVASGWWMTTTTSGLRVAAKLVSLIVPGITVSGIDGSITGGLRVSEFAFARASWSIHVDDLAVEPRRWDVWSKVADIERLSARRIRIDWVAGDGPASPPASLALPFELIVRHATILELQLGERNGTPLVFRRIELSGRMDTQAIDLEQLDGEFERTRIRGQARVGALPPFPIEGRAQLGSTVQDRAIQADVVASGSLQQLLLELVADDSATRARASAALTPFAAVPLERLIAEVDSFDPALWLDDVPSMQLQARADLTSRPGAGDTWSVAGPFSAVNATAGPIDGDRLPVRSVRGRLEWNAATLLLDIERAEGLRGSASGTMSWSNAEGVRANAAFSGIDGSTLHTRATVTEISGQLAYSFRDGEQRFSGSARNARGLPLDADFEARIRDQVLDLDKARLRLGDGRADVRGRIELTGNRAVRLEGSFARLDLSRLVRGIDTQLNGTLALDGRLGEPVNGRARFALSDSRIAGRPITGQGSLQLENQRLDADIELRSGDARLAARGGMGAGRQLHVELAAPELALLVPGYGGSVRAEFTLTGELDVARVEGNASATDLRLPGNHRVANVMTSFRGGLKADEPLALSLELSGHTAPGGAEQSLAGARLIARGTTSDATFELNGATGANQPVRLVANGGIRDQAWRGAIAAAEVGAPLELLMREPAPLVISLSEIALGPANFELRGMRFLAFEVARTDGRWRSSGRFEDLQPQALDAQARAPRRAVRSGTGDRVPLTLAGRWELAYAESVSGIAVIERTGGDIYSGIDGLNPIGVSDVGAALNIVDNRVTGNIYVRGRALGKIDAEIDAYIDPMLPGGRLLAQNQPFRVVVDSDLPDLSWVGPLIGDDLQFGGRATVKAIIGGTPADPTSTGTLRGETLRLAWVEQAVRLENGRLDAALEDGVLVIHELVFAGTPRVAPGDLRALEGLNSSRPFEVRAVGRIALRSLTGSIGLQATQLPVLQRADRWMVVSGDAGITLSPARAELYAKLTVDGAYINFAGARGARSLPADVVVTRPGTAKKTAAAAPVEVTLDVQGDLGQRFYIEGAGLEARLAGVLNVSGRPSQLRGEGSVRTVDGVYAGYGQRLKIERGIVTFQGPVDNPALNVLAVRSGLPVEVGVAISGTAQRPFVRLHSDPSMSDTEKLNWLVLGRPPGASDGSDRALLSAAASALFAGQADSASANLMRSLGIDQITLQPGQSSGSLLPRETVAGRLRSSGASSGSAAGDFLAVGKRINDDLSLSFEQALTGAEYFVALNYRLTRQLSLVARAGSTNALDLVYSIAFD